MAKEVTNKEDNYSQWYNDLVVKADLAENSAVRGCMFPGYKDTTIVSRFFSPAYTTLGFGIDWNPAKWISINFAPLTGKIVFVSDPNLRTKYGNDADEFSHPEFGAQFKMDNKFTIAKTIQCESKLTLFSDYLNEPKNLVVNWDVAIDGNITKHLAYSVRTNLIYDDNIKFIDATDKLGNAVKVPGVQFKQVSSLAFTYTFGDTK